MALTEDELRRESKAKIFNSYYGSAANFLVPILVVAVTVAAGVFQHARDEESRKIDRQIADSNNVAVTRRACVDEMRETAKMLIDDPGDRRAAYDGAIVAIAQTLTDVCGQVGVTMPATILAAVKDAGANSKTPAVQKAAAQVVAQVAANQTLRVFFQISRANQKSAARILELALERAPVGSATVVVPGIETVKSSPRRTELRYANPQDEAYAQRLAQVIGGLMGQPVALSKIEYQGVPVRTFELWLDPDWAKGTGPG